MYLELVHFFSLIREGLFCTHENEGCGDPLGQCLWKFLFTETADEESVHSLSPKYFSLRNIAQNQRRQVYLAFGTSSLPPVRASRSWAQSRPLQWVHMLRPGAWERLGWDTELPDTITQGNVPVLQGGGGSRGLGCAFPRRCSRHQCFCVVATQSRLWHSKELLH